MENKATKKSKNVKYQYFAAASGLMLKIIWNKRETDILNYFLISLSKFTFTMHWIWMGMVYNGYVIATIIWHTNRIRTTHSWWIIMGWIFESNRSINWKSVILFYCENHGIEKFNSFSWDSTIGKYFTIENLISIWI